MKEKLEFYEAEICAGALASSSDWLAVGAGDGYARFSYPDLQLQASKYNLFAARCCGVQLSGRDLILLGSEVEQSFSQPADWKHALIWLSSKGARRRFDLRPGNWAMVKGLHGPIVVLSDTTEGQGIVAVDALNGEVVWHLQRRASRIVATSGDELLAMDDTVFRIDVHTGKINAEHKLPPQDFVTWTAAAEFHGNVLLGGYLISRRDYVLAQWDPLQGRIQRVKTYRLENFFSASQIARGLTFEHECGANIFAVASIQCSRDGSTVTLVLGGDGENLGACQSACSVALIDMRQFEVQNSCLIDNEDGASGILSAPDGALIVNCSGAVYVVRIGDRVS